VEYLTCRTCKSPDTVLNKENRLYFITCNSCGSRRSVTYVYLVLMFILFYKYADPTLFTAPSKLVSKPLLARERECRRRTSMLLLYGVFLSTILIILDNFFVTFRIFTMFHLVFIYGMVGVCVCGRGGKKFFCLFRHHHVNPSLLCTDSRTLCAQ